MALPKAPEGTLLAKTKTAPKHMHFVKSLLPPPQIPDDAGPRLVHFSDLVQTTIGRGLASATSKSYSNAWLRFIHWCKEENVDPLTATPDVLAAYLVWVGLSANALGWYLTLKKNTTDNPMKSVIVGKAMKGLERDLSKPAHTSHLGGFQISGSQKRAKFGKIFGKIIPCIVFQKFAKQIIATFGKIFGKKIPPSSSMFDILEF